MMTARITHHVTAAAAAAVAHRHSLNVAAPSVLEAKRAGAVAREGWLQQ